MGVAAPSSPRHKHTNHHQCHNFARKLLLGVVVHRRARIGILWRSSETHHNWGDTFLANGQLVNTTETHKCVLQQGAGNALPHMASLLLL
jgi:hypothetical protein